ncbi:hypothetical protein EDC01DRAFT_648696 [Geopyxis carbonaria]|nr:hypothetical protein EDC01DRAFT_648696 [Geopyxis carbonaria]
MSTYLKPKVLSVSRRTVNDKWTGLPDGCKEEVIAIVKAAERPVLVAFNSEKRRMEAHSTTQKAANMLLPKLKKIPVPHMAKDFTLDLEKLIIKATDMEAKLHPMLNSIAEFEEELASEQKALQQDEEELKILESNAMSEEQRRIEKLRSLPKSLKPEPQQSRIDESLDASLLEQANLPEASSYNFSTDREIFDLTTRLQKNLYSMKANVSVLVDADLPTQMQNASAAIEDIVLRADESGQLYNSVSSL